MIKGLFIVLILVDICSGASSGTSTRGKWELIDANSGEPCVVLYGEIDLELTYYQEDSTEAATDGEVTIPGSSSVNTAQSSCLTLSSVGRNLVSSQVMQIDFDHMPGWNVRFAFSTDERFQTRDQWALYQVNITANYTSYPSKFPKPSVPVHTYSFAVHLGDSDVLADNIFAHKEDSYYCPSKQKYIINDDESEGPRATMVLSQLQVQAYMTARQNSITPFGSKETCATDQHTTDPVPIIVGGVLAGLIVFTMAAYLLYRACLPPEVIHLVNPSSHENKAMSLEDEDEESRISEF